MPRSTTTSVQHLWQFPSNLSLCNKRYQQPGLSVFYNIQCSHYGLDEPSLNIIIIIITKCPSSEKSHRYRWNHDFPLCPTPKHHQLGLLNIVVEMATKISTYIIYVTNFIWPYLHQFFNNSQSQWLQKALEKTFWSMPVMSQGDQYWLRY